MTAPLPRTAPSAAPPVEAPAQPWTLAETLDVVRSRRLALVESSRGVRVRHRHVHDVPGLDAALAAYAPALLVWLRMGGHADAIAAPWRAEGWDEATRLFAAWCGSSFTPPAEPFSLRPGETVTDGARFRDRLAARLALGPEAPGAARVADDLARLFARFGIEAVPVPLRHFSLAA